MTAQTAPYPRPCVTCKHEKRPPTTPPCGECLNVAKINNWEPKEEES